MTREEAQTGVDWFIFGLCLSHPSEEEKAELTRNMLGQAYSLFPSLLASIRSGDDETLRVYLWTVILRLAWSNSDIAALKLPQTFGVNSEEIWLKFDKLFNNGLQTRSENMLLGKLMEDVEE